MRHDYRSRPQLAFKRKTHEESENPIESLKRVALCPLLEPDGERMERSGSLDSALQFGTALGRSKSKLTIPIAAVCPPPSHLASFLQIVLQVLAVAVSPILPRLVDDGDLRNGIFEFGISPSYGQSFQFPVFRIATM